MFENNNRALKDRPGQYKVQKQVPFTVKYVQGPEDVKTWQHKAVQKSVIRQAQIREVALGMLVKGNDHKTITAQFTVPTKPTFFSNLLQWFLNKFADVNFNQ